MNKFRKISAAALAAALMAGTAVTANAEETQTKLLISADIPTENLVYCGDDYISTDNGFFRVGEEELSKWRETGKFEPTSAESDLNVSGLLGISGGFANGYVQYAKTDADGNVTERYILHLDKANNKIETAYKLNGDWAYTRSDGYTFFAKYDDNSKKLTYGFYDPTGKKTEKTIAATNDWSCFTSTSGDCVGYISADTGTDEIDYAVYSINKSGEVSRIYETNPDSLDALIHSISCGSNYVLTNHGPINVATILNTNTNETYQIRAVETSDGGLYSNFELGAVYNTKAIVSGNVNGDRKYALVDLNQTPSREEETMPYITALSKTYKSMSTNDGETYLVKTEDDKWGYIDANGKELATFDNAGAFIGDYAPVVKDGKAYLIDRNMNKVSEAVDGESVWTAADGLYQVTVNGKDKLMTYASKPEESTSEPTSEPTSTPTSEPTSTPTSDPTSTSEPTSTPENTKNPNTGVPAIAATFGVLALAAGVVIVAKKKR